ncbi:ribonucleoprotein Ro/SS-A-related protein [Plesiocystis pacifica SIR-1]|uniref:Ribonucleoprotein Ro/SS-A-related protein n=1 Tax=Plesiocystis pacifica SIR-1 TaxID=391625 RepID=A6G1X4_9BACT|nr:TROVE domain-containing protein [Plesiocystis pacifica]EDM80164.1 ribonucleoprotein Ro/SS-A-related protein [Plesiocystis pacifica SIR-1]
MVLKLSKYFSRRKTPQSEPASPKQARNHAGGYSFTLNDRDRLERFLILGSEGGTYYVGERALSLANAECLVRCLDADGPGTVEAIASLSEAGRAPKNDVAIFALAVASGHADEATRAAALEALPRVCRTGSHLFTFVDNVQHFRGWGRGLRRAVARWYVERDAEALAYQVAKYRQRNGWSHRDVLRKAGGAIGPHAVEHEVVLRWAVDGVEGFDKSRSVRRGGKHGEAKAVNYGRLSREQLPRILAGVEALKACAALTGAKRGREAAKVIADYRLTHEMVPSELKASPLVWEALLPGMPVGALVRSLGKLTQVGVLAPHSEASGLVRARLGDAERLRKARLHPLAVLTALRVYARGKGVRGSLSWKPVSAVVDSLDAAFYTCFDNVRPASKRVLIALDVSGSMGWGEIAGLPGITPAVGSAAMAMVALRTEPEVELTAFSTALQRVSIGKRSSLEDVVNKLARIPMGGTDCAAPMVWATKERVPVDAFYVYTDNETWHGQVHPHQALRTYRERTGIPAKLIVVGMTATKFTIADPDDAGMLDVVGFDSAAPAIMADFTRS